MIVGMPPAFAGADNALIPTYERFIDLIVSLD